jgi:biotin transport system substrate-specific component
MQTTARVQTLADRLGEATWSRDLWWILGTSFAVGLLAQVEVRLPWTPVPVTLQPFGVFLAAAALGSRRATLAMLAYLLEGAAGLPFFAGGAAGPAHLLGPTGGYLVGFVPAAFVIGSLAERGWDRTPWGAFAAMFLGSLVLFTCGLAQLALFLPREHLLQAGLVPFIAGDVLKMLAAAALLPGLWKWSGRFGARRP